MFDKLFNEIGCLSELRSIISSIENITDHTNKDGYRVGILEAVVEYLNIQIEKEKARELRDNKTN